GHTRHRLSLQCGEIRAVNRQQNLFARSLRVFGFGLSVKPSAASQVRRAAEISDKLADHQAFGVAVKNAWIVEGRAGSQARVIISSSHRHGIGGGIWKESGANL